jgi:integrase
MAFLHRHPGSRFWVAGFRDATGKRCNRSTKILVAPPGVTPRERAEAASKNKKTAQAVADAFEEAARGNSTEAQLRRVFGELSARVNDRRLEFAQTDTFLRQWLERISTTRSPTTVARYKGTVDAFLSFLGPKSSAALGDITAHDVDAFAHGRLKDGRGASTVATDLKTLGGAFNLALKQGLILSNPVAAADTIKGEKESREPFTRDELSAIIRAATGEWKTVVLLGAFAGLRLGDAAGLRWHSVDLPGKVLKLRPSKTRSKKTDLIIPLHPQLESHLFSLAISDHPAAPVSPSLAKARPGGRRGLSKQFEGIMNAAGVEQHSIAAGGKAGRTFNKKSYHSLRHFFVTELENAGIAPDLRQKLAGHSDPKSHGRYTHTHLATLASAVQKLPDL